MILEHTHGRQTRMVMQVAGMVSPYWMANPLEATRLSDLWTAMWTGEEHTTTGVLTPVPPISPMPIPSPLLPAGRQMTIMYLTNPAVWLPDRINALQVGESIDSYHMRLTLTLDMLGHITNDADTGLPVPTPITMDDQSDEHLSELAGMLTGQQPWDDRAQQLVDQMQEKLDEALPDGYRMNDWVDMGRMLAHGARVTSTLLAAQTAYAYSMEPGTEPRQTALDIITWLKTNRPTLFNLPSPQPQAVHDWWHEHAADANPYLDLLADMGAETKQACDSVKTLLAQE